MGFAEKYTTTDKVNKTNSDLGVNSDAAKKESSKIILSNDAFALGEVLESLTNLLRMK